MRMFLRITKTGSYFGNVDQRQYQSFSSTNRLFLLCPIYEYQFTGVFSITEKECSTYSESITINIGQ